MATTSFTTLPHHSLVIGCLNWISNAIGNEIVNQLKEQFHSFDNQFGQLRSFQLSLHHLVEYNPEEHDELMINLRIDQAKFKESLETIITSYMLGVVDLKNRKLPPDTKEKYTFNGISLENNEVTTILFQYYRQIARYFYNHILEVSSPSTYKLCHQSIQEVLLDYVFNQKDLLRLERIEEEQTTQEIPPLEENKMIEEEVIVDTSPIIVPNEEFNPVEAANSSDYDEEEDSHDEVVARPPLLQHGMPFLHRNTEPIESLSSKRNTNKKKCAVPSTNKMKHSKGKNGSKS